MAAEKPALPSGLETPPASSSPIRQAAQLQQRQQPLRHPPGTPSAPQTTKQAQASGEARLASVLPVASSLAFRKLDPALETAIEKLQESLKSRSSKFYGRYDGSVGCLHPSSMAPREVSRLREDTIARMQAMALDRAVEMQPVDDVKATIESYNALIEQEATQPEEFWISFYIDPIRLRAHEERQAILHKVEFEVRKRSTKKTGGQVSSDDPLPIPKDLPLPDFQHRSFDFAVSPIFSDEANTHTAGKLTPLPEVVQYMAEKRTTNTRTKTTEAGLSLSMSPSISAKHTSSQAMEHEIDLRYPTGVRGNESTVLFWWDVQAEQQKVFFRIAQAGADIAAPQLSSLEEVPLEGIRFEVHQVLLCEHIVQRIAMEHVVEVEVRVNGEFPASLLEPILLEPAVGKQKRVVLEEHGTDTSLSTASLSVVASVATPAAPTANLRVKSLDDPQTEPPLKTSSKLRHIPLKTKESIASALAKLRVQRV